MSDSTCDSLLDSLCKRLQPLLGSSSSAKEIVEEIAQASFILTGSLHAGIVAFALGTPFSFYATNFIDSPIKYYDFASFYDIPISFSSNMRDGVNFWLNNASAYSNLTEHKIRKLHSGKIQGYLIEELDGGKFRDFFLERKESIRYKHGFLTDFIKKSSS